MFLYKITNEYNKYEGYLRKALSTFMMELGHQYAKDRFMQIGFHNMPNVNKLRELKSLALGRLMSIHGTVTRTTEVKPELMVGSFKCLECNTLSANMEQ